MLLRHNSDLKKWYRYYSSLKVEDKYESENSFALNLYKFWKMLRDVRVLNPKISLAVINRIFYRGIKNKYEVSCDLKLLKQNIDFLKGIKNSNKIKSIY